MNTENLVAICRFESRSRRKKLETFTLPPNRKKALDHGLQDGTLTRVTSHSDPTFSRGENLMSLSTVVRLCHGIRIRRSTRGRTTVDNYVKSPALEEANTVTLRTIKLNICPRQKIAQLGRYPTLASRS
ncbi:hypothetical protein KIN20_019910 [Parelaphostrongylus tenuis]|uniref:Uncharacterized protein n=1 Tax=Parelaphostrongylus tenuis TaxID=148309 RepID=A0AAD5N5E0_PARTN|nr:hypothetical protein KIN20_019910 [Parelaphostrongylus tenuis]